MDMSNIQMYVHVHVYVHVNVHVQYYSRVHNYTCVV